MTTMKTNKTIFSITVCLALALFALDSCKSDTVSEPSPLGPSSIGVVLDLTASPSVIVANQTDRQISEITANLAKFDGIPLSDRTVLFEVVNESGRRVNVGFLGEELSMQAVTTDSDGTAKTQYFGPLKSEVRGNTDVFIRATVVWDGSQHIQDSIQLYIVRDSN